jgi:hypothetical protein
MRYAALMSTCAALILVGCNDTYHINAQVGSTPVLLTSADLGVITDRPVPSDPTNSNRRAVCVGPSPDVAKALSTASDISAKANVPSGAGGQASLSTQSAEQLAELSGRIPGVVALRDGTFQLCEGWSNGALGDSGYALSLSRYGELLVTLILGDAVSAATRNAPAKLTPVLLANNGSNNMGTGTDNTGTSNTKQSSTGTAATPATTQVGRASRARPIQLASLTMQPMLAAASEPAATSPSANNAATTQPTSTNQAAKHTNNSSTGQSTTSPSSTPSATAGNSDAGAVAAAQALEQMQRNYLTLGVAAPLVVACISSGDTTAPNYRPNENTVLTPQLCQTFLASYAQQLPAMLSKATTGASTPVASTTTATTPH